MSASRRAVKSPESSMRISGYCTECFDLLHTRSQCWVFVAPTACDMLRELTGESEYGYRPVCKPCYQHISRVKAVPDVPASG